MNRTSYETPAARISGGADGGPPSEKSKKYQEINRLSLKEIEHHPERSRCLSTKLINIIDQPCGTGKTTRMLSSFQKGEKYLVVVPLLSEVQRVVRDASVTFTQPETDEHGTKAAHLEALLRAGENIVTTHALYKDLAKLAAAGLLDDHHIFIDEVLDVVQPVPGPTSKSFQEFYLDKGYVFQRRDGLIIPTNKWDEDFTQVSDTLQSRLYRLARSRSLYRVDGEFFLWALPEVLLRAGKSMTVLTYLAEGSLMLAYMRRLEIPYRHERWPGDAGFRNSVSELVTVRGLSSVEDPRKGIRFSFSGQTSATGKEARDKAVSQALKKLRERQLRGVDLSQVLLTCAKENWYLGGDESSGKPAGFSKGSRMFDAVWLPNTTRGTNDFSRATVCIYLYDQYLHPGLARWLGLSSREANDRYALSELIQWVFRSRVRNGQPITLYLPARRMRELFQAWLSCAEQPAEQLWAA
jgi:hypothetical protein